MAKPTQASVLPTPVNSMESLLEAGIPLRTLLAYGERCLDWLLVQSDDRLRISYTNENGKLVAEGVTRVGLLRRASELGWSPWGSDGEDSECVCFHEAMVYHDESTDTWWWTPNYDEETSAPLCFPQRKLASLRAKRRRADRRAQALAAKQAKTARQVRLEQLTNGIVEALRLQSELDGGEFYMERARRRVQAAVRSIQRMGGQSRPSMRGRS